MKKVLVALSLVLFSFWALPAGCFATVGSPNKSGSLLIFPYIEVTNESDTMIKMTNNATGAVGVLCTGDYLTDDHLEYFFFTVPPKRTIWFSAKTGKGKVTVPTFESGQSLLICWAVDSYSTKQISWNSLKGVATIKTTYPDGNFTWSYPSWNFSARQPKGEPVGLPGQISLSGKKGEYDAFPKVLTYALTDPLAEHGTVHLAVGDYDLRQERVTNIRTRVHSRYSDTPKTKKDTLNYMYHSLSIVMTEGGVSGLTFTAKGEGDKDWTPKCSTPPCPTYKVVAMPLLGVLSPALPSTLNGSENFQGIMPTCPSSPCSEMSGTIYWDPGGSEPE